MNLILWLPLKFCLFHQRIREEFWLSLGVADMAGGDLIELKFRLFDGTDIGPSKFDPSTTVGSLKESILAQWTAGKEIAPKTTNDLKLINAGRVLENNQTLAESRVPVGEAPGCVITMHVVVRQTAVDKNNEKQLDKDPKTNGCACTIL